MGFCIILWLTIVFKPLFFNRNAGDRDVCQALMSWASLHMGLVRVLIWSPSAIKQVSTVCWGACVPSAITQITVSPFVLTLASSVETGTASVKPDSWWAVCARNQCRSGFSGADRWLPAYRRRHSVIRPTSDMAALTCGKVWGQHVQPDTS